MPMSRCFPFPPPGYEKKKIRTEEADSLIKVELIESYCSPLKIMISVGAVPVAALASVGAVLVAALASVGAYPCR